MNEKTNVIWGGFACLLLITFLVSCGIIEAVRTSDSSSIRKFYESIGHWKTLGILYPAMFVILTPVVLMLLMGDKEYYPGDLGRVILVLIFSVYGIFFLGVGLWLAILIWKYSFFEATPGADFGGSFVFGAIVFSSFSAMAYEVFFVCKRLVVGGEVVNKLPVLLVILLALIVVGDVAFSLSVMSSLQTSDESEAETPAPEIQMPEEQYQIFESAIESADSIYDINRLICYLGGHTLDYFPINYADDLFVRRDSLDSEYLLQTAFLKWIELAKTPEEFEVLWRSHALEYGEEHVVSKSIFQQWEEVCRAKLERVSKSRYMLKELSRHCHYNSLVYDEIQNALVASYRNEMKY